MVSYRASNLHRPSVTVHEYRLLVRPASENRLLLLGARRRVSLPREQHLSLAADLVFTIPGWWERCRVVFAMDETQLLGAYDLPYCFFHELFLINRFHQTLVKSFIEQHAARALFQLIGGEDRLLGDVVLTCDGKQVEPGPATSYLSSDGAPAASMGIVLEWLLPPPSAATRTLRLTFSLPQLRAANYYPLLVSRHTAIEHLLVGLQGVADSIELAECLHPSTMKMVRHSLGSDPWLDYHFAPGQFAAERPFAARLLWA